jgi:hypothetical protein
VYKEETIHTELKAKKKGNNIKETRNLARRREMNGR